MYLIIPIYWSLINFLIQPILKARLFRSEIVKVFSYIFWDIWWHQSFLLRFTDLYIVPARVERSHRRPLLIVVGQGLALVALLSTYGLLVSFRPLKENEWNYSADKQQHWIWKRLRGVWQYGLWRFQTGGIKSERFLPKNYQHTQRKLLNFENRIYGGLRSFKKSGF